MFSDSTSLTCEARLRGPSNFCAESLGLYGATEKSRTNSKTSLANTQLGKKSVASEFQSEYHYLNAKLKWQHNLNSKALISRNILVYFAACYL